MPRVGDSLLVVWDGRQEARGAGQKYEGGEELHLGDGCGVWLKMGCEEGKFRWQAEIVRFPRITVTILII